MKAVLAAIAALALLGTAIATAQEYKAWSIAISKPWIRATPAGAKVGGGYLKIENTGKEADRLIGGSASVAGKLEVHEMTTENNVMKMRELPKGLEIKPGQTVELKPGSYHIMMMDLKEPLKEGATVKGTLQFEKAGKVDIEYKVEGMGARQSTSGQSGDGHGAHGGMKH